MLAVIIDVNVTYNIVPARQYFGHIHACLLLDGGSPGESTFSFQYVHTHSYKLLRTFGS